MDGIDAYQHEAGLVLLPAGSPCNNPRLTLIAPEAFPIGSFISKALQAACDNSLEFCADLVNTCAQYPEMPLSLEDFAETYLASAKMASSLTGENYDEPVLWHNAAFAALPNETIKTIVGAVCTVAANYLVGHLNERFAHSFPDPHEWETICTGLGFPHPKDTHADYPHSAIGNMIARKTAFFHSYNTEKAKEWLGGVEGYTNTDRWFKLEQQVGYWKQQM